MPFLLESLQIWHQARQFLHAVYKVAAGFPNPEKYDLANYMIRAANLVNVNIAARSGRDTSENFDRFPGIAIDSCKRVVSST
ncbi:MAG: four helix bundle protein [Anaerolineae bacterium]|nr:four helix bundle protein [Anaerolineae bacterium]